MVIAAARNSAAATSVRAVLPKPLTAMVRPWAVPISACGLAGIGCDAEQEWPCSAAMTTALTA